MSPGFKKVLKLLVVPLLVILALTAWHFLSKELSPETLENVDNLKVYAVIGIAIVVGIGGVVFLFYNLFREIYTSGIMRRADKIIAVRIDEENEQLYIETDCYQSGDSCDSFYIYQYYLFSLKTGSKLVHKAKNAKREPDKAISAFYKKMSKAIPKLKHIEVKPDLVIETVNYKIEMKPFKTRFDFGFEVTCLGKKNYNISWKRKI